MKNYSSVAIIAVALSANVLLAQYEIPKNKINLKGIKCVVTGNAAQDREGTSAVYKGGKVFFCCRGCPKAFEKDGKKFSAKANHQLVATKQAKQVKCVFTKRRLNPRTQIRVQGVEITFCCSSCMKKSLDSTDQIEMLFNDKQFANGYQVRH